MKRFEAIFAFLQLPIDFFLLIAAGITAYYVRFSPLAQSIRPVLFNLPWNKFLPALIATALSWIILFAINGLYHTNPNRKLAKDITRVIMACSTGFAGITIYVFFALQKFDSRFLVLVGWIIAMLYIVLGRIALRLTKIFFYSQGLGLRCVAIIGTTPESKELASFVHTHPGLGYAVLHEIPEFNTSAEALLAAHLPDEIIFTNLIGNRTEAERAIEFANDHHIVFKYSADLFSTLAGNMTVATIAGIPIVEIRRTHLSGWHEILKRGFDIVGAIILIIITFPLTIIATTGTILETGWPIIYRSERVGKNGRLFFMAKFRSMFQKDCTGQQFGTAGEQALHYETKLIATRSEKKGPVYKIKNDPRVTPWGKILRRWSLDELPQFWNVLKGDMSLVGPRPHQPREVAQYQHGHHIVLAIRPGITGLSQISGRSDLSFEDEINLDTFYIEHWNILLDLIILLKTPLVIIKKTGAW